MSVAFLGKQLAAQLHAQYLRAQGFRKHGTTFTRSREGYVEIFAFQGSSWNSGEEPWDFYLNVGVRFIDIAPLRGTKLTPTYRHADGRIGEIVRGAPADFKLTSANMAELASELWRYIDQASNTLPSLLPPVRAYAARDMYSALPLPETWRRLDS